MLFFLSLAGLAVLIAVLALGLERFQLRQTRRGQPQPVPRRDDAGEPRIELNAAAAGDKPAPLAPPGPRLAAPAEPVLPQAPAEPRDRSARETAIILALALVALFALGSDWLFYQQLTELRGQQRAWLAPQYVRSERPPIVGRTFDISIFYQNTGREAAGDLVTQAAPFTVSLDEAAAGNVDRKIKDAADRCFSLAPENGARVIYPGAYPANDRIALPIKKELIDWDVVYGVKVVVVPGCYAYRTAGRTHHSAFCFFYQHGFSNPNDWPLCKAGNFAD